ncbi:MAG: TlpA disulfide reductase family protein [Acidobacteriota bacterium]|nr:TlpA family protein disulfide reductase [Blastocatellia bacterium]MDW8411620.1 TlpA disulfide reductase family protein [Acidobacteriota bacterium]
MLTAKNSSAIVSIVLILFTTGCDSRLFKSEAVKPSTLEPETPKQQESAAYPEFKFADLGGKNYSRSDLAGKVVLIVYWATWCPACRKSIPIFNKLRELYSENDLLLLSVSQDESLEKLNHFLATQGQNIKYPVVYGSKYLREFGRVGAVPTIVLMNREGKVVIRHEGVVPLEALQKAIDKIK